jgi:hypothetical protein
VIPFLNLEKLDYSLFLGSIDRSTKNTYFKPMIAMGEHATNGNNNILFKSNEN